jgi:hypothetical protein
VKDSQAQQNSNHAEYVGQKHISAFTMNENSLVYETQGEVIIYLHIDLQRNICQILLAHFKHMLGQATL